MDKELLQEYHDRNIRWTEKAVNQLSFFNNLILSLGVGFIAFGYKNIDLKPITFTLSNIDYAMTLSVLSILSTALSIILGLFIGLNRLWDFRITRQINQIRQNMYEHSQKKLDESTPKRYKRYDSVKLYWRLFREKYPRINIEQCKAFKSDDTTRQKIIEENFRELREITHNLGLNTWSKTKYQTFFFGMGIFLFLLGELYR